MMDNNVLREEIKYKILLCLDHMTEYTSYEEDVKAAEVVEKLSKAYANLWMFEEEDIRWPQKH